MQTPQDLPSSSITEALPCIISSYSLAMMKNIMQNQIPEAKKDEGAFHLFGFPVKSPESSRVFTVVKNHEIKTMKKLGIKGSSRPIKKSSEKANGDSISKSFRLFGVWIEGPGALGDKNLGVKETRGVQHVWEDINQGPLGVFLGKKVLTTSDIDSSSRLLLGRNIKLNQIVPFLNKEIAQLCNTKEGAEFKVWDLDTKTEHTLVLKTWVTKNYVFTGNWMKDFVKRRNLKKDNEIGLYWDESGSRFNFTVLSRQI